MISDSAETRNYAFFSHASCEYFPCHKTDKSEDFNCLFCFCPLYFKDCGGNFRISDGNIKDCSFCLIPHGRGGYDHIRSKLDEYF